EKLEELEKANVSVICIDLLQNVESRLDPLILISYYDIGMGSMSLIEEDYWFLRKLAILLRDRSNQYAANHNHDFIESESDRQMLLMKEPKWQAQ
ncbi:hypothetical protein S83_021670, partial [Arachis hypogaea]